MEFHMKRYEVNLIYEKISEYDRNLFLGPFDDNDGPILEFNDSHTTMSHLMSLCGCFKSISEARKNGWNKPIPSGYQELTFGKKRLKIYILNTIEELNEITSII
jgi:hypothetical protein